jgi:hypothetical protein
MPDSTYPLVSDFSCLNGCNFRIFFMFSLYSPARILRGPDRTSPSAGYLRFCATFESSES